MFWIFSIPREWRRVERLKNKVLHCQPLNKSKFSFQWQRCSVLVEHCRLSFAVVGCRYMPRQSHSNVSVKSARGPRSARATSQTLKMSHATQRNQFRICIYCPDSGCNRFIGLIRFTLSFNFVPHSSVLFIDEFDRLYWTVCLTSILILRFPISSKIKWVSKWFSGYKHSPAVKSISIGFKSRVIF